MAYHHWQVGLDIQNGCLRALAVQRRRRGWQLRQWWQIPLPADTLREGSLQHSDALCDVLTQWRRVLPRRISLRVGFPAQRVLQQLMADPDSRLREPDRSWYIDHQAARQFPIGRESLVLDYRSEPQSPGFLLITAAKREEVAQWQRCLHRAGLMPDVLDIVPCALRTMGQLAGVASGALLLHRLDTDHWLWVSPLSQPLSFGVISQEVVTQCGDIVTCVSNHYPGQRGEITYMHSFHVNLLPWRQRRWGRDTRRWWLWLLFFSVGLLIALGVCRGRLDQQRGVMEETLRTLQLKHLADSTQLREVQRLMGALQQWHAQQQADNDTRAHNRGYEQLLKQLAQWVPDGLWLTAITVQDGEVHLTGRSHDYVDIVHFSSRLETETALTSVRLMQTRQEIMASPEGDVPVLTFLLQADWRVERLSLQDVHDDE